MRDIVDPIRTRVVPAILTGLGVALLMAGLLSYTNPVTASVASTEPSAAASTTASALPTLPSAAASPSATTPSGSPVARVATRVVIPALAIDLPVVKPPGGDNAYPLCDVAMYLVQLHQPGDAGATYLFAHARTGMFLPLLEQSKVNDGRALIGMLVQVYTSDDQLFLYEIRDVRRHVTSLDDAIAATDSSLWLQTSEGPKGTIPKLQVVASLLSTQPADHAAAHPTPHPVACG